MNLKLNELLFLKEYLSEPTPISILNNLTVPLNGTEMLSLIEKGILIDNHISESAVKPLEVIAKPMVCSRMALKNPYCTIEKYLYRKEEVRVLLENEQGEMAVNLFENDDIFIKNWEQWLGNSLVKIADFSIHLTFFELLIFLALVDYNRFNVLRGYLGDLSNKEFPTPKILERELAKENANSLVHGMLKNYGMKVPDPEQLKEGLAGLERKGVVALNEVIKLQPAYKSFAEHFLIPETVLMLEGIQVLAKDEIQAANTLVFGYGLFNWLAMAFESDGVDVFTTTSAELLSVIRDYSRCD